MNVRSWVGSIILVILVLAVGAGLAAWKMADLQQAQAMSMNAPEPMETVTTATAAEREHRRMTTSIGTVLALRSITLRNELAGTVRQVDLTPGKVVEAGTVLVALDVSVEEAELKAQEAQVALAETMLSRVQRAQQNQAVSEIEVERARAEHDVALAQIARIKAIIDRKTIYAPFRARIGMADVHIGQYLEEGTELTTLQGIDEAVHVDFTVTQQVAAGLRKGDTVEVVSAGQQEPIAAKIVAVDARVNRTTRNAMVRARIEGASDAPVAPAPGASVRVRVPVGLSRQAVVVPVSALRKGPSGDHVFVIAADASGQNRATMRSVLSGPMLGDEAVVLEGLKVGEQIAASGSFKLREGVLVNIVGAGKAGGAGEAAGSAVAH